MRMITDHSFSQAEVIVGRHYVPLTATQLQSVEIYNVVRFVDEDSASTESFIYRQDARRWASVEFSPLG
jgi:hypothetical protein